MLLNSPLYQSCLKRLVSSLSRFISSEDAQELEAQGTGIKFISRQPAGGALLLKELWEHIGIDRCLSEALKGREFTTPLGDAIFAMVANRALGAHTDRFSFLRCRWHSGGNSRHG